MEYIGSYRIYYRLKLENKLYFHAWPYLQLITVSLTITLFVSAPQWKRTRPRSTCDCDDHLASIAGMSLLTLAKKKDMGDIVCSFLLHYGKNTWI
jgi:hypothetical protein